MPTSRHATWLLTLILAAGCAKKDAASAKSQAIAKATPASATLAATQTAGAEPAPVPEVCKKAQARGPLAWFSDDYDSALACARETRRPLLIDLWASWCHTCLSMKHTVLVDPSLEPFADRFVWLALDTEKEQNAPVLETFPPQVWPTFYVAAPGDQSVQARYLGAASVTQFRAFLTEGEKAVLAMQAGDLPEGSPLRLIRDGDRAMAQGEWTAARNSYGQALAALPKDSARRPDVSVSMISAFYKGGDYAGCFALAQREMAHTGKSASASDFLYYGTECARRLAQAAKTGSAPGSTTATTSESPDKAQIKAFREAAFARLRDLIADDKAPFSIDDRGDAMRIARGIKEALGDREGALALAEKQRVLLDDAAAKAPGAFAAMTFNWPRAEVYVYLDRGAELIPALQKSVEDLPNEYDPPYRLAWLYAQLGEYDKALPMAEKALALGYGPRKGRIQTVLADIQAGRGDKKAERAAREAVVAWYKGLPAGQRNPSALAHAEAQLAALGR